MAKKQTYKTKEIELVHKLLHRKMKPVEDEGVLAFCVNEEGINVHSKLVLGHNELKTLINALKKSAERLTETLIEGMAKELAKKPKKNNEGGNNGNR